jgi:hypothetical protein
MKMVVIIIKIYDTLNCGHLITPHQQSCKIIIVLFSDEENRFHINEQNYPKSYTLVNYRTEIKHM